MSSLRLYNFHTSVSWTLHSSSEISVGCSSIPAPGPIQALVSSAIVPLALTHAYSSYQVFNNIQIWRLGRPGKLLNVLLLQYVPGGMCCVCWCTVVHKYHTQSTSLKMRNCDRNKNVLLIFYSSQISSNDDQVSISMQGHTNPNHYGTATILVALNDAGVVLDIVCLTRLKILSKLQINGCHR